VVTQPLRIVYCLDGTDVGGTELNALRTALALPRERFTPELVVLRPGGTLERGWRDAGMSVTAFPIPNLYGPAAIAQLRRLAAYLRSRLPAVVHSHDMYTNVFGTLAARWAKVPVVIASRRWSRDLIAPRYRIANRLAYRQASAIVTNSDALRAELRAEGVPEARVKVVRNFVEPAAFEIPDPAAVKAWRSRHGVAEHAVVLGIVARLRREKGHDLLLNALAAMRDDPPVHLMVAGDGPMEGELRAMVRTLGLVGRVTFLGLLPNRPNIHGWFDISVSASRTEGAPNAVLEAMAAGRPVVATDVGGTAEAVLDGETGVLVPPGDPIAMASAIHRLLGDPRATALMGAAAQRRIRANFSSDAVIEALGILYERGGATP
jgi:glycosyltransferase involved in cell wall biosynthesis